MKKTTYLKTTLVVLILLFSASIFSQNQVPFTPRFDQDVKGDIVLIGNNILNRDSNNRDPEDPYNGSTSNADLNMQFIDIDNDNSTYNSSSSNLGIPNPDCYRIIHAGLYWSAVSKGSQSITNVKLKGPSGGYTDVTGEVIFDANGNSVDDGDSYPYACYADVTNIVTGLANNLGTYTVANVSSTVGRSRDFNNGTGYSAGWSLFIVYEDPTIAGKSITSFDGFSSISVAGANPVLDVDVDGFRTLPAPIPVRANFAFAALEGDKQIPNDRLRINGALMSSPNRLDSNFFNSTITQLGARNPNSGNTLGFDTGVIGVPNPGNGVIANGATSATVTLETDQDTYFPYFFALAVEIIEPNILLTKVVEDELGNDIGGQLVDLGDELNYVIGLQNTGNDDATNLIIRDVLPENVVFNYPTDLGILPPGITVQSYDPTTRELVFSVDNSIVEENDPVSEIRITVTVVSSCSLLNNACSNIISNQAFSTYQGTINPTFTISDDPSFSTNTGCLLTPQATNFLADVNCTFTEEVILCGESTVLTAGDGYDSYSWSSSPTGSPVIGTDQSLTVTSPGTYYVHNTAIAPCQSIDQEFEVITFGAGVTNPLIPFADQVAVCPNDGKELPNFFLCGTGDFRDIQTGIIDTSSIIWEKLDEASCTAVVNSDCANEDAGCTWNQVAMGPNYLIDTAGQYRLTLNYTGGCFNQFYFNVYTNLLNPTVTSNDIICDTPGQITVSGIPSNYEYSLDGVTFQSSNVFTPVIEGIHTIYIAQLGLDPDTRCVFTVPDVQIRDRDFTVSTIVTQPLCNGDLGSISLAANDVRAQYYFSLHQGATLVNSVGPIVDNNYEFENLNAGTYTYTVSTDDGCTFTDDVTIIVPDLLTATSAITSPISCNDGEITVYPVGGTAPYFYFVNGSTDFQTVPEIVVTAPGGTYDILVVDSNNCSTTTSITVEDNPAPTFTATASGDILCYNDNNGVIEFNVTDANGYTIEYSIDNGATYSSNSTFSNLPAGTYPTMISYTLGASQCFSTPVDVDITQPDDALTASAGVSELAGCGPSGEGQIRITNPQGGIPPYTYSFDNQTTWVSTNSAYVDPGTYTLYIQDSLGCIYAMPGIILEQEPIDPTITIDTPDFNCDGSANTTVTVTNSGSTSFTYTYFLDGVENTNPTDPNIFLNVPEGSHTVSVEYVLQTVPTFSNLLYETFGSGSPTTTPGIAAAYCFNDQRVNAPYLCGTRSVEDNQYSVASFFWRGDDPTSNNTGAWYHFDDHTTNGTDPDGRFLLVNIGSAAGPYGVLYSKPIADVIPNQDVKVELYLANLIRAARNGAKPDFIIELVDPLGNVIASQATGEIDNNELWNLKEISLNPGANTDIDFVIRSGSVEYSGNDALIDDIRVYQLPKACITEVSFPFVVEPGNAFSAEVLNTSNVSCNGAADGEITIAAQNFDPTDGYQYSTDNGATWNTETTSPYTITGLDANTYNIIIRYNDTVTGCSFPFTETLTAPDTLAVTVTATDITCLTGSTITATATGGSAAYTYQLFDTATSTLVSTFPGSGILTNVPAGNYSVTVTDANDCTADSTPINLIDATPPVAEISSTSDLCYDTTNEATIVVTVTSGGTAPFLYSIDGTNFQASNTFTNLVADDYDVTVRDAFGCEVTLATQTIAPQLILSAQITKALDCTSTPDAQIEVTTTGGYTPFTYEVSVDGAAYSSIPNTGSPFTYTVSTAGTYQFQITDDEGCTSESEIITINAISNPTATTTVVDPTCNGIANGSVQIVPADGVGPYMYSFDGSAFTITSFYGGLSAGTYAYQVQDANECIFDGSVTLTDPTTLVVTATATDLSCNASNTNEPAVVTIDVPTTGTAPYLYSFNGSGYTATNTLTVNDNGSDQTITFSVQDANGCTATDTLIITALNSPSDLDFTASDVTCLATTSDLTVTATNGAGVLTYEITSPAAAATSNTNGIFTGLTPDTYVFTVTDENGCYYTESFIVTPVTPITLTGLKLSDVLCFGDNTGAIQYTVAGYAGTYTANLTSGTGTLVQSGNTIDLTDLIAGSYTLEVTDDTTGCTATETIIISQPTAALTFTATATNVYCSVDDSQITVVVNGGTPSYTYAAVISGAGAPATYGNNSTLSVDTNSGTNLNWDVYVQDANGCITINPVTITADALPTVSTPPLASNQCTATTGFTFTVTGTGVAPLTYSINGGASYQASPIFTVNTPGSYTVTIRDGNGCTATSSTSTDVYAPLSISALLTEDITCSLPAEASIDITVSGGNPAYSYGVSSDGGATFTPTASPFTTAAAGSYIFQVTDANGCTLETTAPIVLTTPTNPDITVTQTAFINCNGEETAAISIIPDTSVGLAPYVYNVVDVTIPTAPVNYGTQTSGLPAGNYEVTVTDAKGCTEVEILTISQPDPIVLDFAITPITCSPTGVSLGEISINSVSGGTQNYTYHVTGVNGYDEEFINQTGMTQVFEVVDFGLYEIIITDANGCTFLEQNIFIASPPEDLDISVNAPPADCSSGGSSDVSVGVSTTIPGSGPYHFAIYTGPGMSYTAPQVGIWLDETAPGTTTFVNLIPGATYTFIVYDENTNCYYFETADIPIPTNSTLNVDTITANNITCTDDADGSVSFDIVSTYGTVTPVSYEILDALTLLPLTPAITGTGSVPANGTLQVTGFGTLDFGNYVVVVQEIGTATNAGCSAVTQSFNITESAIPLSMTAAVSSNANCNADGVITAVAQDGTAPYQFIILTNNDSAPDAADPAWDSTNTFTVPANIPTESYIVYVMDAYGCIQQDDVTLIEDPLPTFDPIAPVQQCFDGVTPISITLVENGTGIPPFTYSIGGVYQADPTFTISAANTYTLSIQDANGCIVTAPYTYIVEPPVVLEANLIKELDCTATPDAQIEVTTSAGYSPFTYEVSIDGAPYTGIPNTGSPFTYTASTSGTYQFQVTDALGCKAESTVTTVEAITNPTGSAIALDPTCFDGNNGEVQLSAAGGSGGYLFNFNGAGFTSNSFYNTLDANSTTAMTTDYTYQIQDSKGCLSPIYTVTLNNPDEVDGSGTVTTALSCATDNTTQAATVTITGTGGTPPYTYSFDGGTNYTTTNTYTTYTAGTVTAYIKDANGCIIATPVDVDVEPLDSPTDLSFVSTPITCLPGEDVSTVTLTSTNGVGPLTYTIIEPASATGNVTGAASGIFTGLAPDTYLFTVTDDNGCNYSEAYTVNPVTNIAVSGLLVSNVNCNGGTDGAVDFTVSNFATTYSYTVNGVPTGAGETANTINLTGLSIGNQLIVVTDDTTGCTDTFSVTVSEPNVLTLVEATNTNANCNFGTQVSVTASEGTPNYTYAFVEDGDTPVASDYTNSSTAVLDPATNTDWDVWVMDSNGCTAQIDVVIDTDPLPTVVGITGLSHCANAAGEYNFTVDASGVPVLEYSIGNGYQTSPDFTVNASGTYTVTVRDGNGCEIGTPFSFDILEPLQVQAQIDILPACTINDGQVTLTATGGTIPASYEYSDDNITFVPGNVFTGLTPGLHTFYVQDTGTTCSTSVTVTLEAATQITDFATMPTHVTCNGGSDGTITATLATPAAGVNDNPVYMYEITVGPVTVPAQNSNVFTGLPAGTYTVVVTSGRGCTDTDTVTIIEPDAIDIPVATDATAVTVQEYACDATTNSSNYATITVGTVTGGSGNYTIYEFVLVDASGSTVVQSGPDNTYTETNYSGGTYIINVYDDNGCMGTANTINGVDPITIDPYIALDDLIVTVDSAITCTTDENITVSVTTIPVGATPNLEFIVQDDDGTTIGGNYNVTNATGDFNGLPEGNYIITVNNLDTGCSLQTVHYVSNPNTFDLTIDTVVDVTCFGGNDGSVNVTFIDLVTPPDNAGSFDYTVLDAGGATVTTGTAASAGPETISGLESGTYTLNATLVGVPSCTVTKNFTITAPTAALDITETHTLITCASGNNDGAIYAAATGGWPGDYEFQLELGATVISAYSDVSYFTGLAAGTYTLTVRDSRGCDDTVDVTLNNPTPMALSATPAGSTLLCFGDNDGVISIDPATISGGIGTDYVYILNSSSPSVTESGPQSSPVFTGLSAGTYTITVTDAYSCSVTSGSINISQPTQVQASLVKATSQTCLTQATLILSASGGTGPYTYSDNSSLTPVLGSFVNSTVPFIVPVGTHQYYVIDANGCVANVSNEITIETMPTLTVDVDNENPIINCAGDTSGVIVATALGGLGNYTYTLQDIFGVPITPTPTQDSPGIFTNLPAGMYQVQVTSGVDCIETSVRVNITDASTGLDVEFNETPITCFGADNGILEINHISGGFGTIKYAISPQLDQFFETNVFEDLAPGTYQVIAQDELGCFVTYDFTLIQPNPIFAAVDLTSIEQEVCAGDLNGAFDVDITGGEPPYSVSIDSYTGPYTTGTLTQTHFEFDGLAGGLHIVYVRDNLGCESEIEVFDLDDSVLINPMVEIEYGCVNNVSGNIVTVTVDGSNNPADLDYSLDGGPYQASNVFIDVLPGIDHYIDVRHTNTCIKRTELFDVDGYAPLTLVLQEGEINEIVAIAIGGAGDYQYTFNGEDTGDNNVYVISESGDYVVTVTDSNGCMAIATMYFEFIDLCLPDYFTPNGDGVADGWGPGCAIHYKDLTFAIFDRYGREVATLKRGEYWDGLYNDAELPTGDYWYVIKLNEPDNDREFVGHFTLYR